MNNNDNNNNNSRRDFLRFGILAAAALPLARVLINPGQLAYAKDKDVALPTGQTPVSEADPVANAMGFKLNAKDIDFTRYPKRKEASAKNQFCKNCALFTALNDGWGKCQLLQNGVVPVEGWCGSWSLKPAKK